MKISGLIDKGPLPLEYLCYLKFQEVMENYNATGNCIIFS